MPTYGPTVGVNELIQVTHWSRMADQAGLNIVHYKVTATSTTGGNALSRLAEAVVALSTGLSLRACMSAQATYQGFAIRTIKPTLSVEYLDANQAGVGDVAGDALPKQTSGFFRKKSDVAGRRKSGRCYIPFPAEDDSTAAGMPSVDYQTRLATVAISLVSQLSWGDAGVALPVIYQRARPGVLYGSRTWTTYVVSGKWATQRRRGAFGKANESPF